MKAAYDFLREGAETNREKHKEYGNNYLQIGAVCMAIFPGGIELRTEDDFNRFHLYLLKLVKLTRYQQNWSKGGHADSLLDDMVYGAMLMETDERIADRIADAAEAAMEQDLFKNVHEVTIRPLTGEEMESLYRLSAGSRPVGIAVTDSHPIGAVVDRIEDTLDIHEATRLADDGCPNADIIPTTI